MNKVILKKIKIKNFKGIASYSVSFEDGSNKIEAQNGEGKTTIKKAWEWVLCQNVEDVVPNLDNKEITGLTTAVEIEILVNDVKYVLARERKDKLDGNKVKVSNDNIYKIDGMEIPQKQYQSQIANIIGNNTFENLIIVTDKKFFNSDTTKWKWTDRRKLLFKMCNVDEQIKDIKENPKYESIKEYIDKGYATSDIKSMFRKEKETLKKEQDKNLILIAQKQKEIDEYLGIDFQEVASKLATAKTKFTKMLNASKKENNSEVLKELQSKQSDLYNKLSKLQANKAQHINELRSKSLAAYNEAMKLKFERETKLSDYKNTKETLDSYKVAQETICPTCKQPLPAELIEKEKANRERLVEELKQQIETLLKDGTEIAEKYNSKLQEYNTLTEQIKSESADGEDILVLKTQISDLNSTLADTKQSSMNKLSKEELSNLEQTISSLEQEIAKLDYIKKGDKQIQVWKDESKEIADKIITVEQKDYALQEFVKEQTDRISEIVNSKFSNGISWSLYTMNYNGSLEEDCICLYNNKRYSSLSNGEKDVADLEVIKTLQDYFDVNIVVFCDNEESVTLNYNIDRQNIGLYAVKNAKLKGCVKITDLY